MTNIQKLLEKDEALEEGLELIILAIKVVKPDLTDEEATNAIINVGMYAQLKRLRGESLTSSSDKV